MPPEGNSNTQPTAGGSIPMPGQLETELSQRSHFLLERSGTKHSFLGPKDTKQLLLHQSQALS